MKRNSRDEWEEDEALWKLLGESRVAEASSRFTDDTVRAVKLLPERRSFGARLLIFSPWAAVACCGVVAAVFWLGPNETGRSEVVVQVESREQNWEEIEEVADAEMLIAAVDHLDQFSDQELVSLIGF